MASITRVQRRRNEGLEEALANLNGSDEERHNLARRFFTGEYTPWPSVVQDWGVFYTQLDVAREMVSVTPPHSDWKVLDLGAGLGVFSYALVEAGFPAENILAIEALDTHCEMGAKLVPGVEWRWCNAFEKAVWQPRMGQFDLVIGNPPWGKTIGRKTVNDDGDDFELITTGKPAEVMAMEATLRYLRPGGKAVLLIYQVLTLILFALAPLILCQ